MMKIWKDFKGMNRILVLFLVIISLNAEAQQISPYSIVSNNFKLSWIYPQASKKEVGKHKKLEFGIRVKDEINQQIDKFLANNSTGLNPYNPEDISVEMTFVSPSFKEKKVYGFYYQDIVRNRITWTQKYTEYNWRVRFSPDEIGRWTFIMKVVVKGKEEASFSAKFKCVASDSKGILKRNYKGDETDRYLYLSETKKTFFTKGHNIAHSAYYKLTPEKAERHKKWLKQLADNGGNFFKLELGAQNGLPDWNNYQDYTSKMPQMWEFDKLTEYAQELGLYFILFRHHTEIMKGEPWEVSKWENNPYKQGFNLTGRKGYFNDKEVVKWQKNALRYIFSRWGYNSSFAFYSYQEMDNWYKDLQKETGYSEKEAIEFVTEWYKQQKQYIKNELNSHQLFINVYATTPDYELNKNSKGFFANSDVIAFHKYGQDKDVNYNDRFDKSIALFKVWNKPVFVEEMGVGGDYLPIYKCDKAIFHNAIWSTSFMGTAGTGMTWWWDRGIHDFDYHKGYNAINNFFEGENLEEEKYNPQKWHNTLSVNRATIENYCLINKNATKIMGWVHNASHFWSNIPSDCMKELKQKGSFNEPYQLEDGVMLGKSGDKKMNFNLKTDAYTNKGVQNVAGKTFEIKGLKARAVFGKKKWYQITYYNTTDNKEVESTKITTNIWGKLKPTYPTKNGTDYSYKIIYLGEGKKAP